MAANQLVPPSYAKLTKEDFLHFPGYRECISTLYTEMTTHALKVLENYSIPRDFFKDLHQHGSFTREEVGLSVGLATFLTVLRLISTEYIFKPAARYSRLTPQNQKKMPESAWKLGFYSCMWTYCCYLLFATGKYNFFEQPFTAWVGYVPHSKVPTDIYVFYMCQFSFYIHSVFATIWLDAWRKDSVVMLFHHFITLALIGFSLAMRYQNIGMLVLFVHDVTDICLEFTKLNVYYKDRNNKFHPLNEWLSNIGFLFFASTWFLFRLYWFPLKVLWASGYGSLVVPEKVPLTTFFNVLLYVLQLMNIYWFSFILIFIYKVATGQMQEVDDLREKEVAEKVKAVKPEGKVQNGPAAAAAATAAATATAAAAACTGTDDREAKNGCLQPGNDRPGAAPGSKKTN